MSDPDGSGGVLGLAPPGVRAPFAFDLLPEAAAPPAPAAPARPAGRLGRLAARLLGRVAPDAARARYGTELTPRALARALSRATRKRAIGRLRRLSCFSVHDYAADYPDLANARMDLHFHALFVGGFEERRLFRPEKLARGLGAAPIRPGLMPEAPLPAPPTAVLPVSLYVSSLGNAFMREIAEDVAASLRVAGAKVDIRDETSVDAKRPVLRVFVAPHEFFQLGQGVAWVREAVVAGGVMLNTEQPQTRWFGRALPFLLAARGVLDLCPQTAALFAATGLPSLHLAPAPPHAGDDLTEADRLHPLFRVLPKAARAKPSPATPFAARPIDVAFFGTESPQRESWLARNAGALAGFECVIHHRRETRGPIRPGAPDGALTRLARHVGGHAKIVLNLHRDAFGYLEWHRIVRQGIATGAVIVSEPCLPHPLLTPNLHYFEAGARQIPALLAWLLRTEDGRHAAATVQANARAVLAGAVQTHGSGARLLGFLHAHAAHGRVR